MSVEIKERYGSLAGTSCCLSCGGAINYAKPLAGEKCLDLGSGRGTDVIRLAEQVGPDGFAWGLDLTPEMIEKARKTAQRLGVANTEFLQAPLEAIPLPDNTVDVVISNCTLNHAGDKAQVWREIMRVLKPGGRFVVSDIYSRETVPPEYADDPAAVAECWAGAITRDAYFDILETTGFNGIGTREESNFYNKGKIEVASITITGHKPTL